MHLHDFDENDELLTRKEAAALLRRTPQTLAYWASSGKVELPLVKIGSLVRYKKSDVLTLINNSRYVPKKKEVVAEW